MLRARHVKRSVQPPCSLQMHHSPQIFMCSPTWKIFKLYPWIFKETSIHRHGWLNHYPLESDFIFLPSLLTGNWGMRLKIPTLYNHTIGSPGNQTPSIGSSQKSPHNHTKDTYYFSQVKNSKRFLNYELWIVHEDQIYCGLLNDQIYISYKSEHYT